MKKEIKKYFEITAFHSAYDFLWEDGFISCGESHDFWEVVFVASGRAQITENTAVYSLDEGEMIFHAPLEFHSIKSAEGMPTRVLILTFSADGGLPGHLFDGPFLLTKEEILAFRALFSDIFAFYHGTGAENLYDGMLCAGKLAEFLIGLDREPPAVQSFVRSPMADAYHEVVLSMTAHLYDNATLSEIASSCHFSVSYIKLLFRHFSGVSPKRYYESLRMSEAEKLLRSGLSAAEVSARMSFSSPGHFSVWLKRVSGRLPSEVQGKRHV